MSMLVRKGPTVHWTVQGGSITMNYEANLFSRDGRGIIDVIHSESLLDLKRAVRSTWGGLRPGRRMLIVRHTTNMVGISPGWLTHRRLTFSRPHTLDPNYPRARRALAGRRM